MNFLKTSDESTAKLLRDSGLQELPKEGLFFVFINNGKMNFSDNKNVIFTNKLNM